MQNHPHPYDIIFSASCHSIATNEGKGILWHVHNVEDVCIDTVRAAEEAIKGRHCGRRDCSNPMFADNLCRRHFRERDNAKGRGWKYKG